MAALHDLSGFGRCSLTIALPVLSVMGVQCCPLPTAWLSTHTAFPGNTFLDLAGEMADAAAHWKTLNVSFDGIFTGYMGNIAQAAQAENFIRLFRTPETLVVVDPVMGDGGRLYRSFPPELCPMMARLSEQADVIVPNRTEAALLLGVDYNDIDLTSEKSCRDWAKRLSLDGRRSVVLTGVSLTDGEIGAAVFDRKTGQAYTVSCTKAPGEFHGTGDLFSSVLTGCLVRGEPLETSVDTAAKFTALATTRTADNDSPRREGLDFEPLLWMLHEPSKVKAVGSPHTGPTFRVDEK